MLSVVLQLVIYNVCDYNADLVTRCPQAHVTHFLNLGRVSYVWNRCKFGV